MKENTNIIEVLKNMRYQVWKQTQDRISKFEVMCASYQTKRGAEDCMAFMIEVSPKSDTFYIHEHQGTEGNL
jgi:hypothetical protein